MFEKIKGMLLNWKTTLAGVTVLLCGGSSVLELLPPQWQTIASGVCTIAVGLGFIVAKDSDKSNATAPSATPVAVN